MSLEGSLQTVVLPEVLSLLADTSKSGELRVSGLEAGGRLWFDAGQLTGFEAGRSTQAIDALFDLLRIESGDFVFDAGAAPPPRSAGRLDIHPLLEEAQARLVEWVEIVAVVPSLAHEVHLIDSAPEGVVLDPALWSLVVTIGEGRPVLDVLDRLSLPEFDGCKAIKQLVDKSLVAVVDPTDADGLADRDTSFDELASLDHVDGRSHDPTAAGAETTDEAEVAAEGADEGPDHETAEPINRGLLLKFLSSVRS